MLNRIMIFVFLGLFKALSVDAQTYTPPTKVSHITDSLKESSGLQFANNSLWSFNDSGNDSAIFRIDTLTNTLFQTVYLQGTSNVDWEDIAFDGTYMYIGDFGNNYDGARTDLKIYKFPYSAIPDYTTNPIATVPVSQIEVISFSYADQPQPPVPTASSNTTKYDCEAMFIDNGQIHLFTKNWADLTTTHYVINSLQAGSYTLSPVETLNTGYLVTAADKSPAGNTVLLLGYQTSGLGSHFIHKLTNYSGGNYFNGTVQKINLPTALTMGQAEGISFRTDKYGYISNERLTRLGITINQMLKSFNVDEFPSQTVLPLQLLLFQAINSSNMVKINWDFDTPVSSLELQKSIGNTNNFITVKSYATSQTDVYTDPITSPTVYYRLVWSNGLGGFLYSSIVNASSNVSNSLSNFHLKQNGAFSFNLSGIAENYSIQITDVDGRIIYKSSEKYYRAGNNQLNISGNLITNGIVFITMANSLQTVSKKVFVE